MPMYVERANDRLRTVIAAYSEPMYPTQDFVVDNDPALVAYLNRSPTSRKLAALGLSADDVAQLGARPGKYVDRDENGIIVGAWDAPQRCAQELAPLELPELQRFLEGLPAPRAPHGYAFQWLGGAVKWRIIRKSDNLSIVQGLESWGACAAEMRRRLEA